MTAIEIAEQVGLTKSTVNRRISSLGIKAKTEVFGRAGKQPDYDVADLLRDWQEKIQKSNGEEPATTPEPGSSRAHQGGGASPGLPTTNVAALVPFSSAHEAQQEQKTLSLFPCPGLSKQEQQEARALPTKQLQQATSRRVAIKLFVSDDPQKGRRLSDEWKKLIGKQAPGIGPIENKQDTIVWVARQEKVGLRTISRWVRQWIEQGFTGLADKSRKDEGRTKLALEQQRHLLKLYDAPEKRKVKECVELLQLEIEVGMIPGPKPTYSACRRFLKRHNPQIIADLTREGDKFFYDHHEPYAVRDLSGIPPNFWWVADFRQVDVRDRDGNEHLGREWMCVLQDLSSAAWIGWTYGPHPSTQLFKSALRMAIQNWGVAGRWHEDGSWEVGHLSLDNGKEFIAKNAVGNIRRFRLAYSEDEDLMGFLEVLGFRHPGSRTDSELQRHNLHLCLPNNARGKSWLESSFNRFSQFERRLAGATGNRPHNRPEKLKKEEEQHSAFLQGRRPDSPLLKRGERRKRTDQFIEVYNWHRRHLERQHIPGQALARVKRSPKPDEAALDILLWYRRRVKAQGDKVSVYFNSVRRTFTDDRLLIASGEYVQVHCDPANPDRALVFQHGKVLCRPRALVPLPQGATAEQLQELGKRQRRLRKQLKAGVQEMRAGIDTLDEAGAVEILAARAAEKRRALTAGLEPSPRLALPGYDEAADMLAEEEPPNPISEKIEDSDVALPSYGETAQKVFTSHTEAERCKPREKRRNGA